MINHKQILSKLKSFKNLYELTKAIQLVALSKLRALKKKELNRFFNPFNYLFNTKKYKNMTTNSTYLYIPITTDRSCCGSINNVILDIMKNEIQLNKTSFYIFLIGKKGKSFTKKFYNSELIYNITNLTKYNLSIITTTILLEKLDEISNELNIDNYIFIFNFFKNIVTQVPASLNYISFNSFKNNLDLIINKFSYLTNVLENKSDYFLKDLYDFSLLSLLIKILYENEMSEYGARASSMRNASKNAEELIAKLQLQYNKARQSSITNELIEIISCVNSIMSSDNLDKYSFYLQYVHTLDETK